MILVGKAAWGYMMEGVCQSFLGAELPQEEEAWQLKNTNPCLNQILGINHNKKKNANLKERAKSFKAGT